MKMHFRSSNHQINLKPIKFYFVDFYFYVKYLNIFYEAGYSAYFLRTIHLHIHNIEAKRA